jgi:hypothetical protein
MKPIARMNEVRRSVRDRAEREKFLAPGSPFATDQNNSPHPYPLPKGEGVAIGDQGNLNVEGYATRRGSGIQGANGFGEISIRPSPE